MPTAQLILVRDALGELRSCGYSAYAHPTQAGKIVVNDPVHCSGRGGTRIEYEHRTIDAKHVHKFIDARS